MADRIELSFFGPQDSVNGSLAFPPPRRKDCRYWILVFLRGVIERCLQLVLRIAGHSSPADVMPVRQSKVGRASDVCENGRSSMIII
jgi:hypothetical protein